LPPYSLTKRYQVSKFQQKRMLFNTASFFVVSRCGLG
jgi:hypothetical protein